jgi:hypothetical protein
MGHLPAQGDAAKPLPGDRVGELAADQLVALVAKPVAELQEHDPQVGIQRDRRAADARVEVAGQRGEEDRVVQQGVDPRQLGGQSQAGVGQDRLPQAVLGLVVRSINAPIRCGTRDRADSFAVRPLKQLKHDLNLLVRGPLLSDFFRGK